MPAEIPPQVENQNGLTGRIEFDTEGQRSHFTLDLLELSDNGLTERGTWSPAGPNISRRDSTGSKAQNQTIIITTILVSGSNGTERSARRRSQLHIYERLPILNLDRVCVKGVACVLVLWSAAE